MAVATVDPGTTAVFARLLGARSLFEAHRTLLDAATACTDASWGALFDSSGRALMTNLPPGVALAPLRPAAWRRAAGEQLMIVAADDHGLTLALGRQRSPFDDDARRRVTALAATAAIAASDLTYRSEKGFEPMVGSENGSASSDGPAASSSSTPRRWARPS
jgi:hypothetical protein